MLEPNTTTFLDTDAPTAFKPPPGWEFSPSRQQYRDPKTKKLYDIEGKPVNG